MQALLHAIYPPHCLTCEGIVDHDFAFCPDCWGQVPFISGLVCSACGLPLMGEAEQEVLCDDCLNERPNWTAGRAALLYKDKARSLVLALKHGDRMDLGRPAGLWMAKAALEMIAADEVSELWVAPIPLHWSRLFGRLYNQSALLSDVISKTTTAAHRVDLLQRKRRTKSLDGLSKGERHQMLAGAITLNPRYATQVLGRKILLVDDVMTSGATFSAAAAACFAAGAAKVYTLALARVAKEA